MSFDEKSFIHLLFLSLIPGIGANRLKNLIDHFKDPKEVLSASANKLIEVKGIDQNTVRNILHFPREFNFCQNQIELLNKISGNYSTIWDDDYPFLLKNIYDPPPFIFYKGLLPTNDDKLIAIVGTRKPTQYGKQIAEQFAKEFSSQNIITVSGLARGIDSIVHSSSLSVGGKTIAIIGSGLDIIYPPENKNLFNNICNSGAVISEFYMGDSPDPTHFPRRNRIISGLSLGTVIIESAIDGGAIITAKTALDQNRDVFCLPGNIFDKTSSGTNKLIQDGSAKLITCVNDVLNELNINNSIKINKIKPELSLFEQIVSDKLSLTPKHIDLIAEETSLSQSELLVTLLSLEFKGVVKQLAGKLFILI
ncbi:MAG: DNA-processing protein DprA [Bacteroidetes bacterium]|nr:DNA-processing protein DprA [Bacteroidota bacterium]